MGIDEVKKILAYIKTNFPNFMNNADEEDVRLALEVWHDFLKEYDVNIAAEAIKAYCITENASFAPTPGQVVRRIMEMFPPEPETQYQAPQQAWELARQAMANSYYNSEASFNALPALVRTVIGSPSRLKQWGGMNEDQLETVINSQFLREYRDNLQKQKQRDALPNSSRQAIAYYQEQLTDAEAKNILGELGVNKRIGG